MINPASLRRFSSALSAAKRGPHWAASQRRIVEAEFLMAVSAIEKEQTANARDRLNTFLSTYPLDAKLLGLAG